MIAILKRYRKRLKAAAAVVAVFVVFSFIPMNFMKEGLETIATKALEEPVHINGNVYFGLSGFHPSLVVYDVTMKESGVKARRVAVTASLSARLLVYLGDLSLDDTVVGDYILPVRVYPSGFAIKDFEGEKGSADITGTVQYIGDDFSLDAKVEDLPYREIADGAKGGADIDLHLEGKGAEFSKVLPRLKGRFTWVGAEGELASKMINIWTQELLKNIFTAAKETTKINCSVADFDIKNGVALANAVFVDTEQVLFSGKGSIDLVQKKVDMTVTPKPKELSLINFAMPLHIGGKMGNLHVTPVATDVAKRVGSILLSTINPAAALVPVLTQGSAEKNPCAKFLQP